MQAIEAQQITDLVVQLGVLLGVVGGIITSIVSFAKSRTSNAKALEALAFIDNVGQYATTFGQKTVEQEERIKNISEALITLSPEAKKFLADNKMTIDDLIRNVVVAREQLEKVESNIPETAKINNVKDFPR